MKAFEPNVSCVNFALAFVGPTSLTNVNGTLFFVANDDTHGLELWKSDGTEAGTVMVKNINPDENAIRGVRPDSLASFNGMLFFSADDGVHGRELWRSDGTEAGQLVTSRQRAQRPDTCESPPNPDVSEPEAKISIYDQSSGTAMAFLTRAVRGTATSSSWTAISSGCSAANRQVVDGRCT